MEKYYEEWHADEYPVRKVELPIELGGFVVKVATDCLWDAIEYEYNHEYCDLHSDAVALDDNIYFYCEEGFIESDPSDEEIIRYLQRYVV